MRFKELSLRLYYLELLGENSVNYLGLLPFETLFDYRLDPLKPVDIFVRPSYNPFMQILGVLFTEARISRQVQG